MIYQRNIGPLSTLSVNPTHFPRLLFISSPPRCAPGLYWMRTRKAGGNLPSDAPLRPGQRRHAVSQRYSGKLKTTGPASGFQVCRRRCSCSAALLSDISWRRTAPVFRRLSLISGIPFAAPDQKRPSEVFSCSIRRDSSPRR